jgi:TetR/AcrR family transcriptional regulator
MSVERRSADTRNKILEVAEQEFARSGYSGAHLQCIAGQVGVQKTALYYYFPSKAALYEAVLARILEAFDQTATEAIARPGPPEARLERLLEALNDLLAERRNYSQILIRIFVDRAPVPGDVLGPIIQRVVGRLLRFYREGIDAGRFAKLSPRHLFQTLLGAVVFHYATGSFGAAVLGVEDIFTSSAVAWRREEMRRFVLRAVLPSPDDQRSRDPTQTGGS